MPDPDVRKGRRGRRKKEEYSDLCSGCDQPLDKQNICHTAHCQLAFGVYRTKEQVVADLAAKDAKDAHS